MADKYNSIGGDKTLVDFITRTGQNITNLPNLTFHKTYGDMKKSQNGNKMIPTNLSDIDSNLIDAIYILDEFGVPAFLIIGLLTNVILAVTIRKSELKKISTYSYFFTIGIVDSMYLVVMFIPWISVRSLNIYNIKGFCQLVYYLNVLTAFLSSWYILMLLCERMLILYKPDKARILCTAFRTKCYITVFTVFALVGHLYLTWTSGVFVFGSEKRCTVIPENALDIVVLRKIDTILSFFLPVVGMLILISCLVFYMIAYYVPCKEEHLTFSTDRLTFEGRIRSSNTWQCSTDYSAGEQIISNTPLGLSQALREIQESGRLSVVSLIISAVYVALFIPHNIIKFRMTFMAADNLVTFRQGLYLTLFEEIYKFNFAYKSIIYFCMSPEMRQSIMKLFMSCTQSFILKSNRDSLQIRL